MKIKNLEIKTDKFLDNAVVLGKFSLNYGAHVAGTALLGSLVLRNFRILPIIIGTAGFIALGINCHRLNQKIAKEAEEKQVPLTKLLNPTTTIKKK